MNMNYESALGVDPELFAWIRDIRRELHRNPELSFAEFKTSALIKAKLSELQIDYSDNWGGTGILAIVGSGGKGAHVALRADMDALPVSEENSSGYSSCVPGVMHACGHDGHVAMLLGAAALLQRRVLAGQVSLIFQPAEEHGNGAQKLVDQGILAKDISAIFTGHIDTHHPVGSITVDEGLICSYAEAFSITITGRGGHAARPHESRDALVAGAHLVTGIQTMMARELDPNIAAVVTVGQFTAGSAHNVIAESAVLCGTVRASSTAIRASVLDGLRRICDAVALQHRVEVRLDFTETLPAVINTPEATATARLAAQNVVGSDGVISQGKPSLGGEDFSFYLEKVPGCMVRFGARGLQEFGVAHSSMFDFDEQVLSVGSRWLAEVACQWLLRRQENSGDAG